LELFLTLTYKFTLWKREVKVSVTDNVKISLLSTIDKLYVTVLNSSNDFGLDLVYVHHTMFVCSSF